MKNNQMLRRCFALLCCCGVLVLWAGSVPAWCYQIDTINGSPIRWLNPSAGFYINTSGGPVGSLSAMKAALQTWTDVPTSNFSFIYKGQTLSTAVGNEGVNLLFFGSLGAGYDNTLALNTYWFDGSTGYLSDSDIKFNTYFKWATDGSSNALDVQTLALHELGHSLSLKDLYGSGDTTKIMYGYCDLGEIKRELTQDDRDGITYLYPGGGSTTTSTMTTGTTTTTIIPTGQCPAAYVLGQDHPYLEQLRAFRDGPLARSAVGRRIIQMYYDHAGSINAALERSPALRAAARKFFEAAALQTADRQ